MFFAFVVLSFAFVFCFELLTANAANIEPNYQYACGGAEESNEVQYNTQTVEVDDNLPDKVDLSISNAFPPIGDQGSFGSCSAWATTYYQFTYQAASKNNWNAKGEVDKRFSPAFTFNHTYLLSTNTTDNTISETSRITDHYNVLREVGAVRYNEFNTFSQYPWYKNTSDETTLVSLNNALRVRIKSFANGLLPIQTNATEPIIVGCDDTDLDGMKQLLNDGYCLVISVNSPNAYTYGLVSHYTDQGDFDRYTFGAICAEDDTNGTRDMSTHAMAIVGYDDTVCYTSSTGEKIYGAFKLANSWGVGASCHENGFMWLMYDALNKKSVIEDLNTTDRLPAMSSRYYWYIEVENYTPELTVEVTVQQLCRKGLKISLCSSSQENIGFAKETFVNRNQGGVYPTRGFDGTLNPTSYQSYTFVFDYDAYGLYEGSGYHYWVQVQDLQANDNNNTIVSKIVWKDKNGNIVYQVTPSDTLDGASKRYCMALEEIEINKTSQRIQKGDTDTLVVTGAPADVIVSTSWHSDNPGCVTVSNGNITAVGIGTATVTATVQFESGVELYAECEYTVVEGYGASADEATVVSLYDVKNGELARTGDVSWFKFTPSVTGKYLLYSVGSTNVVANIYENPVGGAIASGNTSADNYGFLIAEELIGGQTYYIKLSGANDCCGAYSFRIARGEASYVLHIGSSNQDARHVRISTCASSLYDTLKLIIGDEEFVFAKGTASVIQGNTDNNARYKISFVAMDEFLATEWNINIDISLISDLVGEAKTVKVLFSTTGAESGVSTATSELLAYESAFLAGVQVEEPNNLQLLLNSITETGYTYTVYGVDGNVITDTTTGLAATGMKIVKKDSQNRIVKVYHVVVIGDVQGDGLINNVDSAQILRYDAEEGTLTDIALVSGDVNGDDNVNNLDSAIILQYDGGLVDINQQINETVVPVGIYFGQPIGF